jgi:hypothetical protein
MNERMTRSGGRIRRQGRRAGTALRMHFPSTFAWFDTSKIARFGATPPKQTAGTGPML